MEVWKSISTHNECDSGIVSEPYSRRFNYYKYSKIEQSEDGSSKTSSI